MAWYLVLVFALLGWFALACVAAAMIGPALRSADVTGTRSSTDDDEPDGPGR